ncbi:MAG: type II toxin-antitoxin system death-on-curing family toxin [Phycisphaerales bacterium]|jgi:death-on-curing family protein
MENITLKEIEYLAFQLAKEHLSFNEPIPDFTTRLAGVLESCLAMPFMKFSGKSLYRGLAAKASVLFYLMIKNHPFQNGNKRIAMTTLFVFLYKNDKWLKVDTQSLYNLTVWIARSPAELKDQVIAGIEKYIDTYLCELKIKFTQSKNS